MFALCDDLVDTSTAYGNRNTCRRAADLAAIGAPAPFSITKYLILGSSAMNRFVLYRILGNDLPPRQVAGQTAANLRFVLEHEPPLEGCEKRWVVNRIADPAAEAVVTGILDAHGQRYLRIPFVEREYAARAFDFTGLPPRLYSFRVYANRVTSVHRGRAIAWCHRHRIRYLANINGARNAALGEGRGRAEWVLPFDGNCFFTAAAWRDVALAASRAGAAKYLAVPMARVLDNAQLLEPGWRPQALAEPQLGFRHDAREAFDERLRYGAMDKSALLHRLGVPGRWQQYAQFVPKWDVIDLTPSPEAGQFVQAGWVARLYPGRSEAVDDNANRHGARTYALIYKCISVDERIARRDFSARRLCLCDESALGREESARLVTEGLALLETQPLVPSLEGEAILQFKGLPRALDGLRLAEHAGRLAPADAEPLRRWLAGFLLALCESAAGRAAFEREDAVGICHEVLVAALALYLDRLGFARLRIESAAMRRAGQPAAEGLNRELWDTHALLARAAGFTP